jgi:hypothetical protein
MISLGNALQRARSLELALVAEHKLELLAVGVV